MNKESFFTQEMIEAMQHKVAPLSGMQMRNLGCDNKKPKFAEKIEELRESPPFIVIGKCSKTTEFIQNNFKRQTLRKKTQYVMSLGIYQQLVKDKMTKEKILKPSTLKFKNIYKPYVGQPLDNKRLLVWRTGGIGDLCFIQPNLIYIKETYPSCHITFACGPQYQSMIETWDCIDQILDLPFPVKNLFDSDYHVLFEGVIERCKEAHTENAYHLFSRWMGLNLPDEKLVPKNIPKDELIGKVIEILGNWGVDPRSTILLQIRASSPIRSPRPEFWKMIIDSLTDGGHKIVITDTPVKSQIIEDFKKNLKHPEMVFNFAPYSETLDYTIALASLSKLIVGTDSALVHLAASLDVPAMGIFGPFPGKIRLTTYKNVDWIDCKASCAPCFIHGSLPCPQARDYHSTCYDNIDMVEFSQKVERLLKK